MMNDSFEYDGVIYHKTTLQELAGRTIKAVYVSDDDTLLQFATDSGMIAYGTWGECCSETWFADIIGVSALLGGQVVKVEARPMKNISTDSGCYACGTYDINDGRTRQEYDEAYGHRVTTTRGYADIIFRNSSNGCYGGRLVLGEPQPIETLCPITKDWMAGGKKFVY